VAKKDSVEFVEVEIPQSYYPEGGSPRESWRTLYYANLCANFASEVLGKKVVRCGDRSGFVVNALLVPYLLSAIRMVESGVASVEDVDTAIVAGLSHPMGPLRLSDLIGLDTMKLIADAMYDELKDAHYAPPPLLQRMVEAGQLGKKSGKGFYSY